MRFFFLALCFSIGLSSCWSFKGVSIDADTKTFYVDQFRVVTSNIRPNYNQVFAERLKDKIRSESSLTLTETDPDVEFSGQITNYRVSNEAPGENQSVGFGKLTIGMSVDFTNLNNEDRSWSKNYEGFAIYDQNESFSAIEAGLVEEINDFLVEQIFNDAFTQW